jgi:hypothetical protein
MNTPQLTAAGPFRVPGFLFLVTFALVGCGGGTPPGPSTDDGDLAAAVAQSIPDAASNATLFKELFADGAAPEKDRERYAKYQFRTPEKASVSGSTATVKVVVHDDNAGKNLGEATWELVKQGDKWKLKSAPLP